MEGRGKHRARAEDLRERYPYAREVLTLYLALLDVWDQELPPEQAFPLVVKATEAYGPAPLAEAARAAEVSVLDAWAGGAELDAAAFYLARASGAVGPYRPQAGDGDCPRCGGPAVLSYRSGGAEKLVSGKRLLRCGYCRHDWAFSASTCAGCGETSGSERTVYAEEVPGEPAVGRRDVSGDAMLPQLRIEGCESCHRYLIDVDLGRDPRAVPEVDELAALPLQLYAAERGLSKICPNLMGF
ncbi:MAG: formate dehydrogenase accessory protein FdhE [Streptosporangiales bacterium]|nr:formate dehydrogenase accessory protein FdhE [Streptosporangiales bacterium]